MLAGSEAVVKERPSRDLDPVVVVKKKAASNSKEKRPNAGRKRLMEEVVHAEIDEDVEDDLKEQPKRATVSNDRVVEAAGANDEDEVGAANEDKGAVGGAAGDKNDADDADGDEDDQGLVAEPLGTRGKQSRMGIFAGIRR